jgi:hypothetical protein
MALRPQPVLLFLLAARLGPVLGEKRLVLCASESVSYAAWMRLKRSSAPEYWFLSGWKRCARLR